VSCSKLSSYNAKAERSHRLCQTIITAPNGWLGKTILPIFVDAVKNGDFAKLVIITSNESDGVKQAVAAATPGQVEAVAIRYQDKPALEAALKDVDVVINTMGGHGAQAANEQALIEASE